MAPTDGNLQPRFRALPGKGSMLGNTNPPALAERLEPRCAHPVALSQPEDSNEDLLHTPRRPPGREPHLMEWVTTPVPSRRALPLPPPPRSVGHGSALSKALHKNSLAEVVAALKDDPSAATTLLWDDTGRDPPLCIALQNQCSPEIIELLLANGADPSLQDTRGRTAVDLMTRDNEEVIGCEVGFFSDGCNSNPWPSWAFLTNTSFTSPSWE